MASFNSRTGAVMPQSGDYNATQIPVSGEPEAETVAAALSNKAPAGFGFGDAIQEIATASAEESYETYCAKVDACLLYTSSGHGLVHRPAAHHEREHPAAV